MSLALSEDMLGFEIRYEQWPSGHGAAVPILQPVVVVVTTCWVPVQSADGYAKVVMVLPASGMAYAPISNRYYKTCTRQSVSAANMQ